MILLKMENILVLSILKSLLVNRKLVRGCQGEAVGGNCRLAGQLHNFAGLATHFSRTKHHSPSSIEMAD